MKLITEYNESNIECLVEKNENGDKDYTIQGIFAQTNKKNRNGRVYPKEIMEKAVGKYDQEQIKTKRAVGELNHPEGPTVNLDKVSHLITKLEFKGDDIVGKARILDTPNGKIVKGLLEGGVQLGVSTRGMGSLVRKNDAMEVGNDFILSTVDIVQDPSAPQAFVNGIMEGVDWVWNNGVLTAQEVEEIETEIKTAPKKVAYETSVREFKNFLSLIKSRI
tara:strand:- start:2265 stop:2924 length:660 start_codon:yes stop_codon:yes gene_type:complete